jgi:hypothetical protein
LHGNHDGEPFGSLKTAVPSWVRIQPTPPTGLGLPWYATTTANEAPDAIGAAGVTVISPPLLETAAGEPLTLTNVTLRSRKSRLKELSAWVAVPEIVATALMRSTTGRALRLRS